LKIGDHKIEQIDLCEIAILRRILIAKGVPRKRPGSFFNLYRASFERPTSYIYIDPPKEIIPSIFSTPIA